MKNKITAINNLALPVLVYSFGIVNWLGKELRRLIEKLESIQVLKESTNRRQTLVGSVSKDKMFGRGLVQLESIYNASVVSLSKYIKQGKDSLTRLVQEHDARKATYSLQGKAI